MSEADFRLRYGPFALVTGASSGIGQSFAELLAEKGLNLVLVARRRDRLETLAARLGAAHGIEAAICEADLSQPDAPSRILAETASRDVGLLVSNAGFPLKGGHDSQDPAALSAMLMVNCHAPMLLTNGFIPRLRARGHGGIILTSSVEALIGVPFSAAYSATKGFVNRLGEALWAELTASGIDMLTICPGATDTEAPRRLGIDPATLTHLMQPDEVARLALDNLRQGPVHMPSAHYGALFGQLLSIPLRDALSAMARATKA